MSRMINVKFNRRRLIALAFALGALQLQAAAATYHFSKITDSSGPLNGFLGQASASSRPVINNHGVVAFWAPRDSGGTGIYAGNGGPLTTIADTTGQFSGFREFLSLNDAGTVAFHGRFDGGGAAVLTGNGGPLTTIDADQTRISSLTTPSINNAGVVAFSANGENGGMAVYTNDGTPLNRIAERTGPLSNYWYFTGPEINASGQVAFEGRHIGQTDPALFIGDGGPVTTVYQSTGNYFGGHSINDSGDVVYIVNRPDGGLGLYQYEAGMTTKFADASNSSAPFIGFFDSGRGDNGGPRINNDGMITFWAELRDRRQGIFIGPNGANDALLLTGDSLFGSTVAYLAYPDLNDRGDVAFVYRLANGQQGIAVALLVPEPATLVVALAGFAAARGVRYRRLKPNEISRGLVLI